MRIEGLEEEEGGDVGGAMGGGKQVVGGGGIGLIDVRRAVVGAGARLLFYPTLLYNVVRYKTEAEFHWWDEVDEFVLLGAVPFPSDVPWLKQLGVHGVVTLNESFETLVLSSVYHAHGIEHLVIPTRDYLFAPSFKDISRAVDFIYRNATSGRTTYVHCKAGRGRSTTVVLCYLVHYKRMTPMVAFEYVRSSRPRVRLGSAQWKAVEEYYSVLSAEIVPRCLDILAAAASPAALSIWNVTAYDDGSFVVISRSDLDGYVAEAVAAHGLGQCMLTELSLLCRVRFARQAALARLSCLWRLRCHPPSDAGTLFGGDRSGAAMLTFPS